MIEHTKTEQNRFSGELPNLGIINLMVHDLDRIEDLHQIRLSLVSLTRKMKNTDSTRQMALVEVIHALASLEKAQDHIRAAR
jgi:hypothetical protein